MTKLAIQLIACLLLFCSAGLFAAEQNDNARNDGTYENTLSSVVSTLARESLPAGSQAVQKSSNFHAQPLPCVTLSFILLGSLLKLVARMHRKAKQQLVTLLEAQARQMLAKIWSLTQLFSIFESSFVCCWGWQRTVFRL